MKNGRLGRANRLLGQGVIVGCALLSGRRDARQRVGKRREGWYPVFLTETSRLFVEVRFIVDQHSGDPGVHAGLEIA